MNVAELQPLLTELAELLHLAGAESKANDLKSFSRGLKPHQNKTLDELLTAAATPKPPPAPRAASGSRANKTQKIDELFAQIASLYQNAKEPSVTWEKIDQAFAELVKLDPAVKKLEELGAQLDVTEKKLKKDVLIGKLRQSVHNRKADAERTRQ